MRVYVADIVRRELRVFQRGAHHAISAVAILRRLRDVIRIAGHAVADNFGKNRRVALLRVFKRFENHNTRSLADDETVAQPDSNGLKLLRDAAETMRLSARGYHRVLRVARTLADLDGADKIGRLHLAEALSYRALADDLRRAA